MRIRAVVAIVLLLLPAALSAQRIPRSVTGRRGPTRPAPLPPQPGPIARELAYKRSHLSVESYPMFSYVQSPGFGGDGRSSWSSSFGAGTRADYRLTRNVSATLDMTSSFLGSPELTQTAELGTRLRPERNERRVYPFLDVRLGYIAAFNRGLGAVIDDGFGAPPSPGTIGARYSRGFGAVAGVGMEYALTRSFSLTTAGSVLRSRMTAAGFQGPEPVNPRYSMTSFRYTLGLRYNPVRLVGPTDTNRP